MTQLVNENIGKQSMFFLQSMGTLSNERRPTQNLYISEKNNITSIVEDNYKSIINLSRSLLL